MRYLKHKFSNPLKFSTNKLYWLEGASWEFLCNLNLLAWMLVCWSPATAQHISEQYRNKRIHDSMVCSCHVPPIHPVLSLSCTWVSDVHAMLSWCVFRLAAASVAHSLVDKLVPWWGCCWTSICSDTLVYLKDRIGMWRTWFLRRMARNASDECSEHKHLTLFCNGEKDTLDIFTI